MTDETIDVGCEWGDVCIAIENKIKKAIRCGNVKSAIFYRMLYDEIEHGNYELVFSENGFIWQIIALVKAAEE